MAKKTPIKIPPVLVTLGRALLVEGANFSFSWASTDDIQLSTCPDCKNIYLIALMNNNSVSEKLLNPEYWWQKYAENIEKSSKIFKKWNDFEMQTGNIIIPPKGFLYGIGRCRTIIYQSAKWSGKNHKYIHEFKNQPYVWANKKRDLPTVLRLEAKNIKITKRGITG